MRFLATLALFLLLPTAAAAQVDVIRGRVTNAEGLPLPGVRVTATSIPGNVTREVRTNAQGAFQIAFPNGAGDYMMGYALIGYVYRQFQLKRLADEDVLIGDARLSVIQLDTVRTVESQPQKVSRYERDTDVGGTQQPIDAASIPPEARGDLAAMAASLPGVMLLPGIDGAPDGFSVYGLGADQNSVTLNGGAVTADNAPPHPAAGRLVALRALPPRHQCHGAAAGTRRTRQGGARPAARLLDRACRRGIGGRQRPAPCRRRQRARACSTVAVVNAPLPSTCTLPPPLPPSRHRG